MVAVVRRGGQGNLSSRCGRDRRRGCRTIAIGLHGHSVSLRLRRDVLLKHRLDGHIFGWHDKTVAADRHAAGNHLPFLEVIALLRHSGQVDFSPRFRRVRSSGRRTIALSLYSHAEENRLPLDRDASAGLQAAVVIGRGDRQGLGRLIRGHGEEAVCVNQSPRRRSAGDGPGNRFVRVAAALHLGHKLQGFSGENRSALGVDGHGPHRGAVLAVVVDTDIRPAYPVGKAAVHHDAGVVFEGQAPAEGLFCVFAG